MDCDWLGCSLHLVAISRLTHEKHMRNTWWCNQVSAWFNMKPRDTNDLPYVTATVSAAARRQNHFNDVFYDQQETPLPPVARQRSLSLPVSASSGVRGGCAGTCWSIYVPPQCYCWTGADTNICFGRIVIGLCSQPVVTTEPELASRTWGGHNVACVAADETGGWNESDMMA